MKQYELLRMLAASLIRHGLTMLSTYLVAQHMLAPDHAAGFVADLTNYAVDAIPAIIALLWSAVQKSDAHDEAKLGATIAAATPVVLVTPATVPVTEIVHVKE
jgi:hypothetical protein